MLTAALDFLTALELSPHQMLSEAQAHGIAHMGILVQPWPGLPFPDPDLVGNPAACRELVSKVKGSGVAIDLVECFMIEEETDVAAFREALEIACALDAPMVNTLGLDPDLSRLRDNYGAFLTLAQEYRLTVTAEVHRMTPLASIGTAVSLFSQWDLDIKIEIDALHFFRYGGELSELKTYGGSIARAQLCDGPAQAGDAEYMVEAVYRRQIPGKGALPLAEFIGALPDDIIVGIEVPRPDLRTADRIRHAVEASRALARTAGRELR